MYSNLHALGGWAKQRVIQPASLLTLSTGLSQLHRPKCRRGGGSASGAKRERAVGYWREEWHSLISNSVRRDGWSGGDEEWGLIGIHGMDLAWPSHRRFAPSTSLPTHKRSPAVAFASTFLPLQPANSPIPLSDVSPRQISNWRLRLLSPSLVPIRTGGAAHLSVSSLFLSPVLMTSESSHSLLHH